MLTVVGHARFRPFRVLWALEEMGLDYDHIPAMPRSDEIRNVTGDGRIPALIDGDLVVTDSLAILIYLADKHGKLTFPAGSPERARQDATIFAWLEEIEGPLWMSSKHSFVLPEDQRVPEVKPSLRWDFDRAQARLGEAFGPGPYLMGDTFTIADILAGHLGDWARAAKFEITSPVLLDYFDRLRARPAYRRTDALRRPAA